VVVAGYFFWGGANFALYIQLLQGAKKPKIPISTVV